MILVLAGTKDSRVIIERLKKFTQSITASVVTDYGYQLLAEVGVNVIKKRLDQQSMQQLIKELGVEVIVDTTHPFAQEVSQTAIKVSNKLGLEYLRFEREEIDRIEDDLIIEANNYQQAAKRAKKFNRILLTIGSKNLTYFVEEVKDWQERLIARILPNWQFIKQGQSLGFSPKNLIAMQGPFSKELNQVLLQDYDIDLLVTKSSGKVGGLDTKLEAALELGIPILLITRPKLSYPKVIRNYDQLVEEIIEFI